MFIIIPEALALINDSYAGEEDSEQNTSVQFGLSFLFGFALPVFIGAIFHKDTAAYTAGSTQAEKCVDGKNGGECDLCEEEDEASVVHEAVAVEVDEKAAKNGDEKKDMNDSIAVSSSTVVDTRLACVILIGDAFHNFGDGIFIGSAFMLCDSKVGWTVALATLYHEITQELADYMILTNICGLSALPALVLNFISGLTVLLGAVIVLASDFSDGVLGSILTIAGGVYVHVSMESMGLMNEACSAKNGGVMKDRFFGLFMFVIGVVPLLIVTFYHEHCAEAHDHDH